MRLGRPTVKPILWVGDPTDTDATMRVTSPFAPRADGFHGALDIGNYHAGDILVAAFDGIVIAAGNLGLPWSQPTTRWPSGNYGGLMAVLRAANGVIAIYAHMRMTTVKAGDTVTAGQKVGEIGDTGSAQGAPHVHFGVQAPAYLVPSGVNTRATTYGIGLDVDPWPLITAQAEFEDDMQLPVGLSALTFADLGAGNRIRVTPSTTTGSRITDETERVQVFGKVKAAPWTLGTTTGDEWWFIGTGLDTGYVALPLLSPRPTQLGTDVLPTSGITQAELDAAKATSFAAGFTDAKTKARLGVEAIK